MAYEPTATRRRPQTLRQLSGQQFVTTTLASAIDSGKIAHAYLFSGPRGVGKTSSARIVACSLNCEKGPASEPCGVCDNCVAITQGHSIDVIEIDGASNTGVDDIRTIKDEVLYAPSSSRYKIYIIDEVHMLSGSAFNALLKTIEEPPPYIIFIFATTELHKVPATVRSRCQQFNFRLFDLDVVVGCLKAACEEIGITAEEDALLWIARESTGSMRDAYTLFDQVVSFCDGEITYQKLHENLGLVGIEYMNRLFERIVAGDRESAFGECDAIIASGVSVGRMCIEIAGYLRSLLLLKSGVERQNLLGFNKERFSEPVLAALDEPKLAHALEWTFKLHRDIRYTINQRFELELHISRLCELPRRISGEELLKKIEKFKGELATGAITAPSSASPSPSHAPPPHESLPPASPSQGFSQEPPVHAQTGATATAPAAGTDPLSARERIIRHIKRDTPSLAVMVEKAAWSTDSAGKTLILKAVNNFELQSLSLGRKRILEAIADSCTGWKLQTGREGEELPPSPPADPIAEDQPLENLRQVFQGTINRDR